MEIEGLHVPRFDGSLAGYSMFCTFSFHFIFGISVGFFVYFSLKGTSLSMFHCWPCHSFYDTSWEVVVVGVGAIDILISHKNAST